jgi:hypothetical protein
MTTLSSYLVERKIASPANMTEALERQAVLGGDLVTCLLELRLVREESLTPALATVWGVAPAPCGELPATSAALLRVVPGDMAHRFGFYPMSETKDGDMFIAVGAPLPPPVEEELSFALGVRLRQCAAPAVRVRQALERDYGFPLDERMQRLVDQLDSCPSVVPMPIVSLSSPSEEQLAPAPSVDQEAQPVAAPPPIAPEALLAQAEAATAAQLEVKRKLREERLSGSGLAGWARRTASGAIAFPAGAQERVRGPITPGAAEAALFDLRTSDEVLRLFFEFSRQYFEYSALFVVRGDLAEGHDAWGPGAARDKVVTIGVPLDLPGLLATARKGRAPLLAPLGREGLDADLAADLDRSGTRDVFVLPIVVRGRTVALLYGDHGSAAVEFATVGDVIAIGPLVAAAFEKILLKKKVAGKPAKRSTTDRPGGAPAAAKPAKKPSAPPARVAARPAEPPAKKPSAPPAKPAEPSAPPAKPAEPSAPPAKPAEPSAPPAKPAALPPKSWPEAEKEMAGPELSVSEEEMVDEEWVRLSDPHEIAVQPASAPETPAAVAPRPPPVTAAAVRQLSGRPIPREDPPEMTVVEEDDEETIMALLGEIDEHPAPLVPTTDRTGRRPLNVRNPTPPVRGVGSKAISADAQAPPRSVRMENVLPAVVLHADLVEKVIAGDTDADLALSEILALGNGAIPAVFAKFPGPIMVPRTGSVDDLPPPADCGPVLKIVAAMRRLALPFLAIRSADSNPEVRFWATCLLGELHYPDAAIAILARLFDDNEDVRRMAARGAKALAPESELATTVRFGLERTVTRRDEPDRKRVLAMQGLAEIKSYRSAPAIIRVLGEPSETIVKAAAAALSTLTHQSFGSDRRRWDSWWASTGKKRND